MGESSAKDVAVAGYPLPWAKNFWAFRACCLFPLLWAKSFCPFRACCLFPLLWAKSFWAFRACCLYPLPWAKSFCPFRACCLYPLLWAKSFWAFRPYINHLRNLSKQYVRWAPQKTIPPKSHKRTERQGHPPAPERHPPAPEKHPPAPEKHPHSILPRRSPPSRNEPGRRAPCGTLDNS